MNEQPEQSEGPSTRSACWSLPVPPHHTVGVDPGWANGAVVCLEMTKKAPHIVQGAWSWVRRDRKSGAVWVVTDHAGRLSEQPDLFSVAVMVRSQLPASYTLTMEGLYLDQMKKASRILTLAESAGEVVGPLRGGAVGTVARPLASVWRGKVLRASRLSAKAWAARAVKCAPLVATGLGELAENEHAADALCIAYYGGVLARIQKK